VRPVDQTKYGRHDGNCFSACLASILELSIDEVPLFLGPYWDDFLPWLAERRLAASLYRRNDYIPPGYSIAGGVSKRFGDRMHACVAYAGVVVHDPHPSREGLPSGVLEYVVLHGLCGEALWFSGL